MFVCNYKLFYNNKLLRICNRSIYNLNKIVKCTKEINNVNTVPLATAKCQSGQCLKRLQTDWCSFVISKNYCTTIDSLTFEKVCEETLESLCEYFEELVENSPHLNSADVSYSSGVLTVNFGNPYGTYVINRQSPNCQIWLSSPQSGPKRYDFVPEGKYWIYKHDNVSLHQLLQKEIKDIVKEKIDFSKCLYSLL